jgi:hypothetical protein
MKRISGARALGLKALDNLVSVKATIFVCSCVFLFLNKIDQSAWIQCVLIVVGARTANELAVIVKNKDKNE